MSLTLLQKFTPHFKILDPRLNFSQSSKKNYIRLRATLNFETLKWIRNPTPHSLPNLLNFAKSFFN